MGILDRLFSRQSALELPKIRALGAEQIELGDLRDPRLAQFIAGGRVAASGVYITEKLGLRNPALYRSMSLIAGAIGMLPIHLMQRLPDGSTVKARQHPLFPILHRKPNAWQTASEFKSFMQYAALADGNAYAWIIRNALGKVTAIVPLQRGTVQLSLSADWQPIFRYNPPTGGAVTLQPNEVLHFRSPVSVDGLKGLSLFDMATEAIGIAAQAEKAAAKLFRNGSFAPGALMKPEGTLSDQAFDRLRSQFTDNFAGADNAGKPFIFEEGLKYDPIGSNAKDAQHLETRAFQAEEIARITGVPRPLLMFDETSWGSGIEQLGQFFITYCLQPWLTAWEEAIYRSCLSLTEQQTYYAKFNAGALLRGSLKDQADFFAKALGSGGGQGWMIPNEVRDAFDMNNIEGGDVLPTAAGGNAPVTPIDEDEPDA